MPPERPAAGRAVYIVSLGCPKNLVDSERFLADMTGRGYRLAAEPGDADILFINTCAFIGEAVDESREFIGQLADIRARHPGKRLFIAGCLVSRQREQLAADYPQADRFISPAELDRLPHRHLCTPGYYGYLKIAEGCDNHCAYCLIPSLRGPLRSRPLENMVAEARALAAGGVRELNVIAQDTTAYGRDRGEPEALVELLDRLSRIRSLRWVRLLYTHPAHYSGALLDLLAARTLHGDPGGNICPYLDIPFQHGSDRILAAMNRHPDRAASLALVSRLRDRVPGLTLRTTFIVGYPGETGADFDQLLDFARQGDFEKMGIFAFSPEPGTPAAAQAGRPDAETTAARFRALAELAAGISARKLASLVGRTVDVLVEGPDPDRPGRARGRTCGDAPEVDGSVLLDRPVAAGRFARATVTGVRDCDLAATVLSPGPRRGTRRPPGAGAGRRAPGKDAT